MPASQFDLLVDDLIRARELRETPLAKSDQLRFVSYADRQHSRPPKAPGKAVLITEFPPSRPDVRAQVRGAIPGVLAKAMSDFREGRLTAMEVATIEARLHRIESATAR